MRIQNNVMAVNTHRSYTINNDKITNSAEKLSSGFRINKAADDAAGLAISEKMRSQIRGLSMAVKNCRDANSLIQTAEGALSETHSILQRMNELAVQATTGTNENFDRIQLAKEYGQLKREIDDISQQTTFNNINLLDGSLSTKGLARSNYSSGIYAEFIESDSSLKASESNIISSLKNTPVKGISNVSMLGGMSNDIITDSPHIALNFNDLKATSEILPGELKIQFLSGNLPKATILSNKASISVGMAGSQIAETLIMEKDDKGNDLNSGAIVKIYGMDNKPYFFMADPYWLNYNQSLHLICIGTDPENPFWFSQANLSAGPFTDDYLKTITASVTLVSPTTSGITGDVKPIIDLSKNYDSTHGYTNACSQFDFDISKIKNGDSLKIGNLNFVFSDSSDLPINSSTTDNIININEITDTTSLVNIINDIQTQSNSSNSDNRIYAFSSKNTIFIKAEKRGPEGNKYVKISFDSFVSEDPDDADEIVSSVNERYGNTLFTLDPSKMKIGDKISYIGEDGTTLEHTFKKDDTPNDIMHTLGVYDIAMGDSWEIIGETDQSYRLNIIPAKDFKEYAPLKIQVGALEGEQLAIKIDAMNTKGLKIDTSNIYTQNSAGEAITATRNAINTVSDQRALLGAMQNRLNHKTANLNISIENLQNAESRIRDIDIADEMSIFTKNNVLSQAATAILAQANLAPQNVISLLK